MSLLSFQFRLSELFPDFYEVLRISKLITSPYRETFLAEVLQYRRKRDLIKEDLNLVRMKYFKEFFKAIQILH